MRRTDFGLKLLFTVSFTGSSGPHHLFSLWLRVSLSTWLDMSTSAVPSGREPLKSDGSGFTEPYPSVGERQSPRGDEASKIGQGTRWGQSDEGEDANLISAGSIDVYVLISPLVWS